MLLADELRREDNQLVVRPNEGTWPNSLEDFKKFWNSRNVMARIVMRVEPELYFLPENGVLTTKRNWTPPCKPSGYSVLSLKYRDSNDICSEMAAQYLKQNIFCADDKDNPKNHFTVAVPVQATGQALPYNLRFWLTEKSSTSELSAKDLKRISLNSMLLPNTIRVCHLIRLNLF